MMTFSSEELWQIVCEFLLGTSTVIEKVVLLSYFLFLVQEFVRISHSSLFTSLTMKAIISCVALQHYPDGRTETFNSSSDFVLLLFKETVK